jgi:hypothetical protein
MKYAVEMGSGAVIYIPSFIKIGSAMLKIFPWVRAGNFSYRRSFKRFKTTHTNRPA